MKNIFVIVLTIGVLGLANNASALLFNGHNYEFIKFAGKSWDEATLDLSTTLGSEYYLASITTQDEQDFIANSILDGTAGQYWLGGFQPVSESNTMENWNWTSGETWSYTNWRSGEPNDYYGVASEQHLAMWKRSGWNWEWNDEGNARNISGYIAESAAPVPEPTTIFLFGTGLIALAAIGRRKKK